MTEPNDLGNKVLEKGFVDFKHYLNLLAKWNVEYRS